MKYLKCLILVSFIFFFLILIKVSAQTTNLPLLGKIIYVDPGHVGTPNTK